MSVDGILKYGDTTPNAMEAAHKNFPNAPIRKWAFCCTPIELLANNGTDKIIGAASGFFWLSDRPYLITNWHVISGRNPFTGEVLSKNGFIPSRLVFYGHTIKVQNGQVIMSRQRYELSGDDNLPDLLSSPPKLNGEPIDLFAVHLPEDVVFKKDLNRTGFKGANTLSCFINEQSTTPIVTAAGDDCFVLGYPLRNYAGSIFPIWKRASLASETSIGLDNRPMFLVDAATTPGMSGSPIIRKVTSFAANDKDVGAIREIQAFDFIGVYAGRLENPQFSATNIGYAWYQTLIPEVIAYYNYGQWKPNITKT